MELHAARQIIDTLAQGVHPVTGEVMPDESPYNAPPVIRALMAVSEALERVPAARAPRALPANAGKPWTPADDEKVGAAFSAGANLSQLARDLGRTPFAVETRLVKLGKLPPLPGMRFVSPAA
ncbi:MAG: hypothetical protein ABIR26_01645 [Ramlibacter sp.]